VKFSAWWLFLIHAGLLPEGAVVLSVPSKKILHEANLPFSAHAIAQPCGHTTSEAFHAVKGLCDISRIWNSACCNCARMRFHCAVARRRGKTGRAATIQNNQTLTKLQNVYFLGYFGRALLQELILPCPRIVLHSKKRTVSHKLSDAAKYLNLAIWTSTTRCCEQWVDTIVWGTIRNSLKIFPMDELSSTSKIGSAPVVGRGCTATLVLVSAPQVEMDVDLF